MPRPVPAAPPDSAAAGLRYQPTAPELVKLGFAFRLGTSGIWQHPPSDVWLVLLPPSSIVLSVGQYDPGTRHRPATKAEFYRLVCEAAPGWGFHLKRKKSTT